jgi:hypothetical protein
MGGLCRILALAQRRDKIRQIIVPKIAVAALVKVGEAYPHCFLKRIQFGGLMGLAFLDWARQTYTGPRRP